VNRINEIEARLQAATPGPWEKSMNKYSVWSNGINDLVCSQVSIRDANFIAHAPDDLRWALDEIKVKDAEIKELELQLKTSRYHGLKIFDEGMSLIDEVEAKDAEIAAYEAIGKPGEVVNPVRCEDCLHGKPHKMVGSGVRELTGIQCTLLDLFPMWEGDYCSYGVRRESEKGGQINC